MGSSGVLQITSTPLGGGRLAYGINGVPGTESISMSTGESGFVPLGGGRLA